MPCSCGTTLCECQDICLCHPDICDCWPCYFVRRAEKIRFRNRGATCSTVPQQAPNQQLAVHPWTLTGRYPDLSFLNRPLQLDGGSDARNDAGSTAPQDTPEQRESRTDDLMFQMDDIHSLPAKPKTKKSAYRQIRSNAVGSNSRQSQIRENTTIKINSEYLKLKLQEIASKREESQVTETQIKDLPGSGATVLEPEEPKLSEMPIIGDLSGSSKLGLDTTVLEPGESKLTEMPIIGDLSGSSKLSLDTTVSKPEESENISISSSSNMYSSESLPSGLSNDSTASHNSTCSLSHTVSTSAPSTVDLQQPCKEIGSSKQKSDTESSSETSPTFVSLSLKELRISGSCPTERKLSASSSSVETISEDLIPETSTSGQNYEFPPVFSSLCNSMSNISPIQSTTIEHKTSETLHSSYLKLSNKRTSKLAREKTTSESSSSIETLDMEPLPEDGSPSISPKKDDSLKEWVLID